MALMLRRMLPALNNFEEEMEDVLDICPSQLRNVLIRNKHNSSKLSRLETRHLSPAAHQQQQRQHKVEEGDLQLLLQGRALPQLQPLLQTERVTHRQNLECNRMRFRVTWIFKCYHPSI